MSESVFDFAGEFAESDFIICGHGDGRGTEHVKGWRDLQEYMFFVSETDLRDHEDDWEWSDENPSQPFWLSVAFEAEALTIIRLHKSIRVATPPQPEAPAGVTEEQINNALFEARLEYAENPTLAEDVETHQTKRILAFLPQAEPNAGDAVSFFERLSAANRRPPDDRRGHLANLIATSDVVAHSRGGMPMPYTFTRDDKNVIAEALMRDAGWLDIVQDARRYRRLTEGLEQGTVSRFSNLDKIIDDDLRVRPSRGEASPLPAPPQGER